MKDDGIPDCIRRDANNRASFMVTIGRVQTKIAETFAPAFAEIFPNPEANLPATPPNWVPPWQTKI